MPQYYELLSLIPHYLLFKDHSNLHNVDLIGHLGLVQQDLGTSRPPSRHAAVGTGWARDGHRMGAGWAQEGQGGAAGWEGQAAGWEAQAAADRGKTELAHRALRSLQEEKLPQVTAPPTLAPC